MKKNYFTTVALLVCSIFCFIVIADLNGKWVGTLKAPDGNDYPLTYIFKVDGNALTGSLSSPQGDLPLNNGKVNGNDFSFTLDFNGTPINNVGKYYVDSVALDAEVNGTKFHTVLKRAAN